MKLRRVLYLSLALFPTLTLLPVAGLLPSIERVRVQVEGSPPVDVVRAIPLYRGVRSTVTISGKGVDACRRVEAGPDVSIPEADIKRSPGTMTLTIVTGERATLGDRELRLRYEVELAGPERFPIRVLRNGEVLTVEPRRVPRQSQVTLTFTGRDLGNADVLAQAYFKDAKVLPGGTESRVQVQLVFTREGRFDVPLYDTGGIPRPGRSLSEPGGYRRHPEASVDVSAK